MLSKGNVLQSQKHKQIEIRFKNTNRLKNTIRFKNTNIFLQWVKKNFKNKQKNFKQKNLSKKILSKKNFQNKIDHLTVTTDKAVNLLER